MKHTFIFAVLVFLFATFVSYGQFDDLLNKVKDKAQEKKENAEDSLVNKVMNPDQNPKSTDQKSGTQETTSETKAPTIISYKNYDFVPGDKIIFESDLADEQVGEIPSQFDLTEGQMDVQEEDGENVIHVPKGPGAVFTPRMSNTTYMPDQFTIEFDFKNELFGLNHLDVDFGQRIYYSGGEGIMPGMQFGNDGATWTLGDVNYPEQLDVNQPMQWHHIAIAINKTAGKIYVDQFRIINVNNLTGKPNNVTIVVNGYENSYIKNIRIAAGGIGIYKKMTTETKIVTHGILFDVDKSTIKPQSMGTLNQIYTLLKKDPSLKFEIDGHTDNTGDSKHNLDLSQQRADAVKTQLVSMGIDASRLSTKGFGDTKPMDSNDNPEGRANNRRVEFIKM